MRSWRWPQIPGRRASAARRGAARRPREAYALYQARSFAAGFLAQEASRRHCTWQDSRSAHSSRQSPPHNFPQPEHVRTLAFEHDALRLRAICRFVEVNRTEAVCVPHDGNACGVLGGPHERVAPAPDDKVDIPSLCKQRSNFRACLKGLYERGRKRRARKCGIDRACGGRGGASRLLTTLEDRSVAYVGNRQCELVRG